MRLDIFSTSFNRGYIQRVILDPAQRPGMRLLGMVSSLLGWVILSMALGSLLTVPMMGEISDGFLALLWLAFGAAFVYGCIYTAVQAFRGQGEDVLFGWFGMWKRAIELGPIAVYPRITPRMQKEAKLYTLIYAVLISLPIIFAVIRHS